LAIHTSGAGFFAGADEDHEMVALQQSTMREAAGQKASNSKQGTSWTLTLRPQQ